MLRSTEEKCERTFEFEKQGLSRTDAKKKAKINGSTYYGWLKTNHPDTLKKSTRKTPYTAKAKSKATKPVLTVPFSGPSSFSLTPKDLAQFARELLRGE